jgi:hypothetical protein
MPVARGSIVRNKEAGSYGFVRLSDNGRLSVKSIADDNPSSFYDEDDFVPASGADVPWFKPMPVRLNENNLYCWELPSGEMVCEDESVWFSGGCAFITRVSLLDPDSPSPVLR